MLVKYRCAICGISETEDLCFARLFRSGLPPTCDGPTSFPYPDNWKYDKEPGVKRSPHEMTEMEIVQD